MTCKDHFLAKCNQLRNGGLMTIPPPTTVEMMDSATVYMKRGCDYDDYYAHIYGCGFIPEHVGAKFRQLPTTEKTTTVWTWSYPIGFSVPPGFRFSVPSRPRPVSRLRPVKPSEPNTDADEDLVAEILTTEATTNENDPMEKRETLIEQLKNRINDFNKDKTRYYTIYGILVGSIAIILFIGWRTFAIKLAQK